MRAGVSKRLGYTPLSSNYGDRQSFFYATPELWRLNPTVAEHVIA